MKVNITTKDSQTGETMKFETLLDDLTEKEVITAMDTWLHEVELGNDAEEMEGHSPVKFKIRGPGKAFFEFSYPNFIVPEFPIKVVGFVHVTNNKAEW